MKEIRIAYQVKRWKGEDWNWAVKETYDLYPDDLRRTVQFEDEITTEKPSNSTQEGSDTTDV